MSAVLITGAGRGIGRATAVRMAEAGWDVFAGVRDLAAGKDLQAASDRIVPIELDVTDPGHIAVLAERLPARLDAVVNNAGIAVVGPVEAVPIEELRRQLEINVIGQIAVTQAVLPKLRESAGRVVFVSSVSGRVSSPLFGPYAASKFAIEALADGLRVELRPWRISVVLIEPGMTDTDIWRGAPQQIDEIEAQMSPQHRELYAAHIRVMRKVTSIVLKQTSPVDSVAAAIERSLTAKRPRARYVVGATARAAIAMRALTPTRVLDASTARMAGWK